MLERINQEKAKQFISIKEDYTGGGLENASFFTLTPSTNEKYPASEGWEDVTYYTPRKKNMFVERGDGDQWVYILSNPTTPNLLKIGYTKLDPDTRAQQISRATGVALPYKVEWAFKCFNGEQLEGEVHRYLNEYRVNNNREFFEIELTEAKKAVMKLGENYV
tara:strand:+ start:487 stop:975 length:489 start_codon:yes stop_codon:yes gene_type:complete